MIQKQIPTVTVSVALPELLPAPIFISQTGKRSQNPVTVGLQMKISPFEQQIRRG